MAKTGSQGVDATQARTESSADCPSVPGLQPHENSQRAHTSGADEDDLRASLAKRNREVRFLRSRQRMNRVERQVLHGRASHGLLASGWRRTTYRCDGLEAS